VLGAAVDPLLAKKTGEHREGPGQPRRPPSEEPETLTRSPSRSSPLPGNGCCAAWFCEEPEAAAPLFAISILCLANKVNF